MQLDKLKEKAFQLRCDALWSLYHAGSGHPGGVLSCADIISCVTTFMGLSDSGFWQGHIILSKGHSVPTLYAAAVADGILKKQELTTLRHINSRLQGHPDITTLPWLEVSTGSLGQGFSFACGLAKGHLMQKNEQNVYAILGDGELQEGQVWEAAMFSAHHKLTNLCAIIDYNKLQSDAANSEICTLEPLADKWSAFGWNVQIIDGHNCEDIMNALHVFDACHDKPSVIIANTVKGKGVKFMEHQPFWHGSVALTTVQFTQSLEDLGCDVKTIARYTHD